MYGPSVGTPHTSHEAESDVVSQARICNDESYQEIIVHRISDVCTR